MENSGLRKQSAFFTRRHKASGNACISIRRRMRTSKTRKACFISLLIENSYNFLLENCQVKF